MTTKATHPDSRVIPNNVLFTMMNAISALGWKSGSNIMTSTTVWYVAATLFIFLVAKGCSLTVRLLVFVCYSLTLQESYCKRYHYLHTYQDSLEKKFNL